ncbi:alpha-E domain-containing protein [Nocardioides sp. Kera G14]|uniref:alpha-E domain-containing protein n=1 Tax=Nocardioides sp. Kera G14 TaxID=2884264 RepID=UPI001D10938E|nr:alpha-E domain-containing protein [Nocardioides sp. Kera G14]UDY25356.1 alpha-E domain-containing protein [Nocardioides sp. Kera G14]
MLSRIAESIFWIGRYIERMEDTARILDVQTQLVLEDAAVEEEPACRALLSIMGIEEAPEGPLNLTTVQHLLAYDTASTASIAFCLNAARESARGARETLSVPLWEALNTAYRAIPTGQLSRMRPPAIFQWARERAALIDGTAAATMLRDEGYHFLVLGRCLERADMTSRLVATAGLSAGASGASWTSALRACGGYESFLRTNKGVESERAAAEFLLLDRLFPRSVIYSLTRAEECLDNLEPAARRTGFQNEAQRLIGRMKAELEFRTLSDLMANLPDEMEALQRTCATATAAIDNRYFAGPAAMAWLGA